MPTTDTATLPPEGWAEHADGRVTFVQHGASFFKDDAPEREGFKVFFVARHGRAFTRWTYRAVTS